MKRLAQVLLLLLYWQIAFEHVVQAQMIVPDGLTETVVTQAGSTVTDIHTSTLIGGGAGGLNSFQRFNVDEGHTVNLHLPPGATSLINLVHQEASEIQGVLNSIQGDRIGGNVYFLNPHGVIVSKTGVVNVGSLYLYTPAQDFMASFYDGQGGISESSVNAVLQGTVPVSPTGLVRVDGRVYSVGDIHVEAGKIAVDGVMGTGAVFDATGPHFANVVNLSGLESMQFISTENGQIKLVAATDVEINDGTLYTDGAPDVDAAAIRIEAGRTIQVGPGAVISAEGHGVNSRDGAIELVARSTVASDGEGAETGTSIDVLGGEIRGGSILLQAAADADFAWEGSDSIRKESGEYLDPELAGEEITVARAVATSAVKIADGSVLRASGDIDIRSFSKARLYTAVEDKEKQGLNLGFVYGHLESRASVTIASGATLSGGRVSTSAINEANLDLNIEGTTTDGGSVQGAFAYGVAVVDALVHVERGANIVTPGHVLLNTENHSEFSTKATSSAKRQGNAGAAAAIFTANTAARSILDADLTGIGSLAVRAINETKKNQTISATVTAEKDKVKKVTSTGTGIYNWGQSKFGNSNQKKKPNAKSGISLPTLAAALSIAETVQTATASISDGVQVKADGLVELESSVVDRDVLTRATSSNSAQNANVAVSAAVAYGDYQRDSESLIGDNARIEASSLSLDSQVLVPYEFEWTRYDGFGSILDKVGSNLGLQEELSGYANATNHAQDLGIAGSILFVTHDNRSESRIGRGVDVALKASQDRPSVSVTASTSVEGVYAAGNIDLLTLKGTAGGDDKPFSVGGSYTHVDVENDTLAHIAEGAVIRPAAASFAPDVTVSAATQEMLITITPTAGQGSGIGVNGAFAYANIDNKTHASIDDEAQVNAGRLKLDASEDLISWVVTGALNLSESAGVGLSIAINDVTTSTRAFIGDNDDVQENGSQLSTEGKIQAQGVSVNARTDGRIETISVALAAAFNSNPSTENWKDKAVNSYNMAKAKIMGQVDYTNKVTPDNVADLSAATEEAGVGVVPDDHKPSNAGDGQTDQNVPNFGIGVSGSSSVNEVAMETLAIVNSAIVEIVPGGQGELVVGAVNDADIGAFSGGAALLRANNKNSEFKAGVAGSLAVNLIDNRTKAEVINTSVTGVRHMDVYALIGAEQLAVASGLSANISSDQSKAWTTAGSVSVSIVGNTTEARLTETTIAGLGGTSAGDADVVAYDRTRIGTGGGALMIGGKLGVGAALTYAEIANTTEANVSRSTLSDFANVRSQALNASLIGAAAAMGGYQSEEHGFTFAGSVVVAQIENATRSTVDSSTLTRVGDVSVVAYDTAGVDGFDAIIDSHDCQGADCPQIAPILDLEAAGLRQDGSIDQALAGAAADAGTNVTNMVGQANQALSDAGGNAAGDPGTDGGIGFEPGDGLLQGSSIVSVAGYLQAGQNNVGVSIAWNEIANTFSASIVDSTVEASGDTEVKATSNASIINVSVGLGMADQFTGGASVALNYIHNTTSAEVKATSGDPLIDTRALRVVARDRSELNAGAGNVAFGWGKDGPGSGGVTVAFSGINNTTQARIDDYKVQASGDVDVTAANDSVIRTFAVAAAVSTGGAMLAGSGAFSEIGNVTEAAVVSTGSRSIHAGGMTVTGRDDSMIIAVSGELAATGGKVAVGGAAAVNWVANETRALVENVDVVATGDVAIGAESTTTIGTGSASAAGDDSLAIGGSATVSVILNSTEALLRSTKGNNLSARSLSLTAHDASKIYAAAGQIGYGTNAAIGGAVVHGQVLNRTRAALENVGTSVSGDAVVNARNTSWVFSVGASGGASQTAVINGSVTSSFIGNQTMAEVVGGPDTTVSASTVSVSARDQAIIGTLAGQLGVSSGSAAVGGATTVSYVGNTTRARVQGVDVQLTGDLLLDAHGDTWIVAGALAGQGASQAAVGASLTTSVIDNATEAELTGGSTSVTAQNVGLHARDDSKIFTVAGQLAGSGNTAVGAGIAVAVIANTTRSRIVDAHVDADRSVDVEALSQSIVGSIGVSGQGSGQAAAGASNTTNTISNATVAEVSSAAGSTVLAGSLRVEALDQARIYTLAGQISGAGNTAVGGAVAVGVVANETWAIVSNVDVDVAGETDVEATNRAFLVIAGAAGSGSGEASVAAGVATAVVSNTTIAAVESQPGRTVRSGTLQVKAKDSGRIFSVAGQAAGGGSAAVGGAAAHNQISNETRAIVNGGTVVAGNALSVEAESASMIRTVGASGALSVNAAVDGSIASSHVNNVTEAELLGATVTGATSQVTVRATDESSIESISGAPAAAVEGAGIGIAMAVNQIGNTTRARVSGGSLDVGNLLVQGRSQALIRSVAASVGLAAIGAGVAGSTAVNLINNDTLAGIEGGAAVLARGNAGVIAWGDNQVLSAAGVIAGAGEGAGVGLSATVNEIGGRTAASISGSNTFVSALAGDGYGTLRIADGQLSSQLDLQGALQVTEIEHYDPTIDLASQRRTMDVRGVAVNASSTHQVQNYVANAAAGLFGGAAGLANVNLFLGTTEAYIDSARINRLQDGVGGPAQSVHVGASDHSVAHDYVLSAAGGAVGAGGSLNTTVFARDTLARIEGGGDLRATDGIVVDARSSQGSASVVAGAAAGGFGGAGSANMALILGTTEARIRGRAVYAGDVSVHAHSIGRLFTSAGGAAAGVTAVAGAFAVAVDQGTSRALIENAYVETTGQVSVDAQSDTEFQTWSASGSGGSTGVAGSAVISVVQRTTESFTHNTGFGEYNNGVGGLSVSAVDRVTVKNRAGAVGAGGIGAGGVAAVTTIGNTTNAYISGGAIFVRGDVAVEAESERYLSTLAASGGLGGTTLAVNVAVILAGAHLAGDALDQLDGQDNPTLSYINAFATSDRVVTSGDGQTIQLDFNYRPEGPEGQVNAPITMDDLAEVNQAGKIDVSQALQDGTLGATVAQIRGATVWVDGNVTVDARTLDRANIISGGAGLGFGAAFGASVAVVEMANKVDAAVLSDSDVEARQGRIRIGAGAYGLLGRQDADDILCDPASAVAICAFQGAGGTIALGAAVAAGSVNHAVSARAARGTKLTSGGTGIVVEAVDEIRLSSAAHGYQLGSAAAGAAVATATRGGVTQALVSDEASSGKQTTLSAAYGSISVAARREGGVNALTVAGAGGVHGAATGSGATAHDGGTVKAALGNQVSADASYGAVKVNASASPLADATARGYGGSIFAAVGASVARATAAPHVRALIGSGGTVRASSLDVRGAVTVAGAHSAKSFAEAAGLGLLAGAEASVSEAKSAANVTVSVGSYLQIAGDAWIGASNVTSQHATASGITGGIAAAGATVSSATANGTTWVDVTSQASGSVGGRLTVNASGWDGTYSEATSGSGGVVEGAAAVANTGNYSQTIARLGTAGAGITAGAVDVAAGHTADFDGRVNTLRASVVGMSGAVSSHSVESRVQAAIADGARLVTYDLTVLASNHSRKHYFGDSAFQVEAGSGGILDAAAVSGSSTIRHETESLLGQGADVRVVGSWEDPGRANIAAVNQVSAKDSVRLDSGGAISVALATSRIDANLIGRSVIGDGARLETVGDLNVGVRTAANVHASANAKTYGASGAAQGYSASQVQATERVRVGRGAQIVTEGDANFYAGRDADGWDSAITAIARTDLFNKTALPIATNPDADAVITRSGLIDIEEDASVRTVGDMYLLTANGNLVADGQGTGTDLYRSIVEDIIEMFYDGDLALHIRSGKSTRSIQSGVIVHGTLESGIKNKQFLVFDRDGNLVSQSDGIEYTVSEENLAENLLERLKELYHLRTAYGIDDVTAGAFDAEIQFVLQQLRAMGYPMTNPDETETGMSFIADDFDVEYINVSDVRARGGNITVTGSYLAGSGTLRAASDAEITIENHSNRFLRLNRLVIDDSGGHLFFNKNDVTSLEMLRDINDPGSPVVNLTLDVAGTSPIKPSINVTNSFIPSSGDTSPVPDIEVAGDIINPLGGVRLTNARGNIKIQGETGNASSISAQEVALEASEGSILQSYNPGVVHVGSDPTKLWGDLTAFLEGLPEGWVNWSETATIDSIANQLFQLCYVSHNPEVCKAYDQLNDLLAKERSNEGSIIAGNNILLSARYLNINGTIQSGIPDRILDASESGTAMDVIRQRIETIQAEWEAAGRPTIADVRGIREYRISDGIGENVSVYFNPQTQQIIVDDIEVKGGYVELYGHIMSTGSGQIKALDGYGRIDLRFARFGYDVVVHTLDTGGVQGVIRITDLGKTNDTWGGPVTTVYERVGGHVRTQEWVGDKLISESVATEAGREAVYRPVANQAFVWKRGQDFTTTYIGKKESSSWFDIIPGGMMEYDTFIKTPASGVVDLPNGEYVTEAVLPRDYYFERRQYVSDGMKLVNRSAWSECSGVDLGGWCFGVRYYYLEDTWKEGSQNIYTHMVRADYPIGIEFIGHDAAPGNRGIWVQSSDRLILNGNVRHTGGETYVSGDDGIIQASDDVLVTGQLVRLSSFNGTIGDGTPIHVRQLGGGLFAQSIHGDINLRDLSDTLLIQRARAKGVVRIDADGPIDWAAEPITGERVELTSRGSRIGRGAQAPIQIQAGTGSQGGLIAKAQGDIALHQVEGDLHVVTVESVVGDVWIDVKSGALVDANRNERRDERTIEQLEALWSDMQLLEGEGAEQSAQATLDAYRTARESEYHLYWRLRGVRPVFDEDGSVRGYEWDPYDPSQAGDWMDAEQYARLHEAFGAGSFDPDFTYVLTAKEEEELTEGYAWTRAQLQHALPGTILFKRTTSTETRDEDPNIVGRNVYLYAMQNGIGTDRGEIVITSAEQLKDEEIRLALAAAESDDVAVDEETGHVTILLRDTIDVEAAESVWVEARDHIYLGSRAPLYVRLLTSHQLDSVRIKGKEGLFDVSTESAAIYAGSAILEGGDGGIGEADRPFRIGLSAGGTLTARAAGDIYVRDVRTSINVAQVYSQGDVYLDAWGSIVPAGDSPLAIQGENIKLVARVGGVGTSERPLVLQSGPSGRITASVASGRGIYINGIGGVVRFGALSSTNEIALMAAGSLHLAEMISAPTVRLTAAGAITQDPSASIVATTLQADSGAGQTLIGDNQVGWYFAFNASGDIEFVNAGELRIQGIQQSGGSVSITSGGSIYFDGLAKLDAGGERGNLTLAAGGTLDLEQVRIEGVKDLRIVTQGGISLGGQLDITSISAVNSGGGLVAISTTANGPAIGDVEQVDGGDIQITGTGPLVLSGVIRTVDGVSIMASGDVAQAGSSRIVAGQLVTQSAGGLHLDGANEIGVLTVTNNGGAVVVNNVGTLQVAGISQLSGGDVSLTAQGGIILRGAVATQEAVALTATGAIASEGNGRIAARSLTTQSVGGLILSGANQIGSLTVLNDGGDVAVSNEGDLEIAGISQLSGGDVRVTNDGAIEISGAVVAEGAVNLTATGSIVEKSGGKVEALILTAQSAGGLDLGGANQIGGVTVTNNGGAVIVNNLGDLDIAGINQLSAGDVVVTSGGVIEISGAVVTQDTVALTSTGSIAQVGAGRISAASLSTESAGGLRLGGDNEIGVLAATNDGGDVEVRNLGDLVIAELIQLSGGNVRVTNDSAIVISGAMTTEDAVDLTAGGSIAELTDGQIAASILTADSAGGIDLAADNRIGVLVVTNDGGDVVVRNLGDLEIAGINQLSGGNVRVTNDGAIQVSGAISAEGSVDLAAAGPIAELIGGQIAASTLTAESAGGIDLGGDNRIGVLVVTNDGGDVVVRNLGDLEIAELIQLDGGNVVVANDGAIMISGAIETQDQVDLAAAGSISQTSAGRIAASSLTVQSTGGLDLGGGNEVSLLALTNDGGNVVVRNLGALEIAELIQLSGGDVRVTNDGAIVISGAIETQGEVDLAAAGSVSQTSAGRIAASSLKVQSTGGLDLGGGNEVSLLALTNDGGDVVVHNLGDLEIAELIQLSGGDVRVTNDGAIVISGEITAENAVDLVSTGTIAETGAGQIMALILTTQSVGGLDLGGANQIGTILVTNDGGDVVVRNLGDLEIAGISQLSGGNVLVTNDGAIQVSGAITAEGSVDLAAAGPIAELIGGQITASILTAESAGGIDLVGDNRIGVLVVTNDGGDVVVRNLGDLEIAEIIQLSGGDVLVTSDGAIAVSGTITTDEAVGLTAARSIAQVGAGRIAAASLSTESAGGLQLGGDNAVGVLTATNDGGNVVVRNLGALEIAELIQLSGGDVMVTNDGVIVISGAAITEDMVSLTSTGSIAQVGAGRIAAASLWTESAGGLRLGGDNVVSLLALTNDGGDVVVHNLGDLEIAELIQLSGGDVRVTNDGAIAISGEIKAENAVDLVSTGTIAETGAGQIMALILTTQSVGGLDLGGANQIGTILVTNDGGDVVVRNLGDLEIAGISQLSGGDVRVTNDGKIEISGVVATADTVALTATGAITGTADGQIAASALTAESAGGIDLGGDNRIGVLVVTNDGGDVVVRNLGDLEIAELIQLSGGNVVVTTDGALDVRGAITTNDAVTLTAVGSISEVDAGRVVAASLTTQSGGGLQLDGANEIGVLTATNDGGDVVVRNLGALEIAELVQLSGGDVLVTNDGAIQITGAISTEGAVDLTAGGSIVELTGGQIAASILTAKSTGGLDLSGANEFSVLVVTNDGGAVSVNNLADLDIAGIIQLSGGDVVVTNDGSIAVSGVVETQDAVHLAASTSIAEIGAGRIAAESLTTQSAQGTRLLGDNTVARFAAHDSGAAAVELRNLTDQLVIDKADAGAGVLSIWQSGGLALAGPLMTLGDILLFAGGPIVNVDPTDLAAVIGRNLDLRSVGGGIGNADKRVAVQASGVVNLTAEADVYLRSQGDLNVDLLQALSGSVDLMAQSGIISVNQLSLATGDEASSEIVQTQAGGSTFARFQGQAIRVGRLTYGGLDPLELTFLGDDALAEYVDVDVLTGASVVVTRLEAVNAYFNSTAHDLRMEHVLIGRRGEFVQGDTSVAIQVPPGAVVDADVLLYSDQPFFLTFQPDGTVSTDATVLYVRPGSSAIPGGMQNSVIGITQALDSVMRQETQGGSDNASGAGPSGGRGLANADGGPQGGGSVVTAGSDESGQTVQTGGLGAPGFIGEMTLDSNGTLSVTPSDVTAQLDGNALSDGAGDEDDDEDDDDTGDEDEDEEAQEEAGEEERSDE